MKRLAPWIVVAAAFGVALVLRYRLVEPEGYGFLCEPRGPWWCAPRDWLILAFHQRWIGWAALGLGVAAFVTRRGAAGLAAAAVGAFGLVLYNYEPAAVGFALGALVLARTTVPARTGTA